MGSDRCGRQVRSVVTATTDALQNTNNRKTVSNMERGGMEQVEAYL